MDDIMDDTLILNGAEFDEEPGLEDDLADMDIDGDGDDEANMLGDGDILEDPDDDEFKLDGYDDLGIIDESDSEEDLNDAPYDPDYDENATGQKRKRVKSVSFAPTPSAATPRAPRRSVLDTPADPNDSFILHDDDAYVTKPTSRIPGTFGRRGHRKGDTLPAYHKRVSHELDSDDEMMMEMREKGFSDRQIADRLAKEGRVRYDQKSISTRIMRIRLAQAGNVDFLLKEGYKEWQFEDDCLLHQAYALADIEISYEVERIRAWRFRKVSDYMRRLNKDALFSETACRERYNALTDGTAMIPTELDDDPDARRVELENFRSTREDARNKEQAIKDRKEALERKAKEGSKAKNAQKAAEVAERRGKVADEKAQRAVDRAAAAQNRAERQRQNTAAKLARNAQIQKQEETARKRAEKREAKINGKGKGKAKIDTTPKKPASNTYDLTNAQITSCTPDPRIYLAVSDLTKMSTDRGVNVVGKTKDQLIAELQDMDSEWTLKDLQTMCRSKGLVTTGKIVQLRYHLALAAAKACTSFAAGVAEAKGAESEDDAK